MIRVSVGTAGVLGLAQVPMDVPPTTAYFMLGGRCAMNCAFCAQARDSQAKDLALSRVTWPEFPLDLVCERLREAEIAQRIRRCCVQVTAGRSYWKQTVEAVSRIRQTVNLPLNVAILPSNMAQVAHLVTAGVDRVGFGLDAACERVFCEVKGGHWSRMVALIQETAARYRGRAAIHLIVGLGETEKEMVERVIWARDQEIDVGLFAFTPIRGTLLAQTEPPVLAQYRRMQAACALILDHGAGMDHFGFGTWRRRENTLLQITYPDWKCCLSNGRAFRTLGCPDCNRPYYNERPGGVMYNYPRELFSEEMQASIAQMELGEIK